MTVADGAGRRRVNGTVRERVVGLLRSTAVRMPHEHTAGARAGVIPESGLIATPSLGVADLVASGVNAGAGRLSGLPGSYHAVTGISPGTAAQLTANKPHW